MTFSIAARCPLSGKFESLVDYFRDRVIDPDGVTSPLNPGAA